MNLFDKFCAVFAFLLGAVLIILGVLGLFEGCNAHFALPPVAGVVPAFIGWGIVRPIIYAWRQSGDAYLDAPKPLAPMSGPAPVQPQQTGRPV
ncbi:MAG: hypothetical protein ACYTE6_07805 [Planctomycetota bacterium]|jgi:hypothetical protein